MDVGSTGPPIVKRQIHCLLKKTAHISFKFAQKIFSGDYLLLEKRKIMNNK